MKKIILVLLLFTSVLTSCNKVDNSIKTGKDDIAFEADNQTSNETEQSNTISEDNSTKMSDNSIEKIYDVVDEKYDDNGIHIIYPQIINLSDNDKQKKINEMIKSEALVLVDHCKDEGATLEANYKITFESKNILSLQFEAHENHKRAAHPLNKLYTLNINMNNCTKLKLKDFINVDENLVDKFRQCKVSKPDETEVGDKAFNILLNSKITGTTKYLLECFNGADSSYETSPFTFSYFTKDALIISTEVSHSFCDHIQIELKYEDIKDNIKSDNEIWKELLNSHS